MTTDPADAKLWSFLRKVLLQGENIGRDAFNPERRAKAFDAAASSLIAECRAVCQGETMTAEEMRNAAARVAVTIGNQYGGPTAAFATELSWKIRALSTTRTPPQGEGADDAAGR